MKILEPVKRVVDYKVKTRVRADGSGVDLANVKMSMNLFDEIALEEAIRLRKKGVAEQVIDVSIGVKKSAETLRKALAMGVDKTILIVAADDMHTDIEPLAVVGRFETDHDITPGLAVVLVGADPSSEVYVRNEGIQTREIGRTGVQHRLPATTGQDALMAWIARLTVDPAMHGIPVQLPLPAYLDAASVITIVPAKDTDGFHVLNVGLLAMGQRSMVPGTPLGSLMMLRDRLGDFSGLTP